MDIEKDFFKRCCVLFDRLLDYGFIKCDGFYLYEKVFFNGDFKAIIKVDSFGVVTGSVIDLQFNDEYLNFRSKISGEFINKVRNEYYDILNDIKMNCFFEKLFIFDQSNRVVEYIRDRYNNDPEFLWDNSNAGVFRSSYSDKWYGIIIGVDLSKLDSGSGLVEVLNVKLDKDRIPALLKLDGFYEAYHMSKKYWISIILNDSVSDDVIFNLIDESYELVK